MTNTKNSVKRNRGPNEAPEVLRSRDPLGTRYEPMSGPGPYRLLLRSPLSQAVSACPFTFPFFFTPFSVNQNLYFPYYFDIWISGHVVVHSSKFNIRCSRRRRGGYIGTADMWPGKKSTPTDGISAFSLSMELHVSG